MAYQVKYTASLMRTQQALITPSEDYGDYVDEFCDSAAQYIDKKMTEILDTSNSSKRDLSVTITKKIATDENFGQCASFMDKRNFCNLCQTKIETYFSNLDFDVSKSGVVKTVSGTQILYSIQITISWKIKTE